MARIRTVKPEFWTDEKVVECSIPSRLLFIGLFNFANDMGCLERSPKRLKMQIFPADALDCEPLIQELITHGLLTEYSVNDVCYLQIKGFLKHQKINRPSASKIPLPPEFTESKAGKEEKRAPNQGGLSEDSVNPHGGLTDGKGREGKRIKPHSLCAQGKCFSGTSVSAWSGYSDREIRHARPLAAVTGLAATGCYLGNSASRTGIPADRAGRVHRVLEIRGESVYSGSVGAEICPQRDKCQSQIQTTTSNRR